MPKEFAPLPPKSEFVPTPPLEAVEVLVGAPPNVKDFFSSLGFVMPAPNRASAKQTSKII